MFGRKKRKGGEQINVDLPITPMLDMAFQILAFFVVIFRPTPQEGQISMYLPKAEGQEQSVVIPPPSETPIDVPKEYTVRASASSDGMAAALTFIDEAGREPLAGAG